MEENFETRTLSLWLNNDEGSYSHWRERAQECYDDEWKEEDLVTRKDRATRALASEIEDETTENKPEVDGFYSDVLDAAINAVDWFAIAREFMEEVEEEIPEEDEEESEDEEEQ